MKSTFATNRRFSCFIATIMFVRLEMSLPPPVPGSRVFGARGIADERRIQIAELVDLRAAHEPDIDIAALQQQQHVGAAQHHVGALGAALVVGRWRQLAGLDEGADDAALEQDGQPRAVQPLRQRGGEQRNADAGEHHLAVPELPRAQHRQHFGRRVMALALSHCRCSGRAGSPPAAPPFRSGTDNSVQDFGAVKIAFQVVAHAVDRIRFTCAT